MNDESDNSTNNSTLETVGTAAMAALSSLPAWLKTGVTTIGKAANSILNILKNPCLLYTSDAADDMQCVDLGGGRVSK